MQFFISLEPNPRALILDDEPSALRLAAEALSTGRFLTESHEIPEQALSALGASSFDLVVLDINLPGMNGLEVLAKMRETLPSITWKSPTGCRT